MLGKLFIAAIFLLPGRIVWAASEKTNALEISPLKATLGQPSGAYEGVMLRGVSGRVFSEYIAEESEQADMQDRYFTFALGVVGHPRFDNFLKPLFFGAGLSYERAVIGRSRERGYLGRMQPNRDDSFDTWVNQYDYLSAYQTLGLRWEMAEYLIASLSFTLDELLQEKRRVTDKHIYSYDVETDIAGRERHTKELSFMVGVQF